MSEKSADDLVWEMRLAEVAKNLEGNNFIVTVLPDMASAVRHFKEKILPAAAPKNIGVGGSETLRRGGLFPVLEAAGAEFINPYEAGISPDEALDRRRRGIISDLFVASSNALIRDGRILNLDGTGNRVAAIVGGAKKVVLFIGRNKICEDLEAGISRIREFAAPANNIRLKKNNPCTKVGYCMDCKGPGRICNAWTLTARSLPERIHVLLINENLGY